MQGKSCTTKRRLRKASRSLTDAANQRSERWLVCSAVVSHNAAEYNSFVHVGGYTSCGSVSGKRDHLCSFGL